ncbi:MAG TPA: hypothetical protein VGC93_02110 [Thermoanaerobaculia bacterium]
MLDTLTHESFAPHVGSPFEARLPERTLRFELLEVVPSKDEAPGRRRPFSLVFRGPCELYVPQQIVPLEHAALGKLEIFLVPIGLDAEGYRYEAVFN